MIVALLVVDAEIVVDALLVPVPANTGIHFKFDASSKFVAWGRFMARFVFLKESTVYLVQRRCYIGML